MPTNDTTTDDASTDIQIGDVALDLAQGRPVHVVDDTGQTAAEWADANDYELAENYGNARLGASDGDRVFDVVYCSSAKSEPSKTYAFPESRLLRIETEAATEDGRAVADRVTVDVLERVLLTVLRQSNGSSDEFHWLIAQLDAAFDDDILGDAVELAESARELEVTDPPERDGGDTEEVEL
jgi:hypothetical protein